MAALQYDGKVMNPPQTVSPGDEPWLIMDNDKVIKSKETSIGPGQYMWKELLELE